MQTIPPQPKLFQSTRFLCGRALAVTTDRLQKLRLVNAPLVLAEGERLRLNNLAPQPGSKKKKKRKGRGHAAGQGGSCGFGMRGQKSRSGPGVRTGFEGGQTPLYRRLPKLRGIAGGMPSGRTKFVVINVGDLNDNFEEGEEVSIETLKEKRMLKPTGKERNLPLKVLGNGELTKSLTIKAATFSEGALEKVNAAGCVVDKVVLKPKWTRQLHKQMVEDGTWEAKRKAKIERKKEKKAAGIL